MLGHKLRWEFQCSVWSLGLWWRGIIALMTGESIEDPILELKANFTGRPLRFVSSHLLTLCSCSRDMTALSTVWGWVVSQARSIPRTRVRAQTSSVLQQLCSSMRKLTYQMNISVLRSREQRRRLRRLEDPARRIVTAMLVDPPYQFHSCKIALEQLSQQKYNSSISKPRKRADHC